MDYLLQNTDYIPQMRTIAEISNEFNLSYDFVRKLCLRKEIIFVKTGVKHLINRQKFIEFLNSGIK